MLVVLFLLPQVVNGQLYVTEYNLTYSLGEDEYEVEEIFRIKNGGNPFIFPSQVEIFRGDAKEMEAYSSLYGSTFFVEYEYPTRFALSLKKTGIVKEILLVLKYKRKEGLFRKNKIRHFMFPDIGRYPWGKWEDCVANYNICQYNANIKIIAPKENQFGNITPTTKGKVEDGREVLMFGLTVLENITVLSAGFPVDLEFADYNTLATSELNSAKSLVSQSYFTLRDANITVINAKNYEADVANAAASLEEAVILYEMANSVLMQGEQLLEAPETEYYRAYLSGIDAIELARQASGKAAEAKNLANLDIQNSLEKRITALASNLSQEQLLRENLGKTLVENLSQKLGEVEKVEQVEVIVPFTPPPGRNYYEIGFFVLLGGLVLYGVANLVLFVKGEESRARGKVSDYRVIGDLKRKSFEGFERKVDTVKHEVDLATEIRRMRKGREKYLLGIENLRKKKLAGEIKKKTFTSEKNNFEKQISEIDTKLEELEAQLKEMKEKGSDEAGKAD